MHCLPFCVAKDMHLCQERWVAGGGRDTKEGLYRGALASRVKLHKFRQILMNCAVVPGGERENGNEATLIKSGERIRSHSLDKAPHQPKNTLAGICRNLAGFTRFAR